MSTNLIKHLDLALLPVKHKKLLCNNLDRDESWIRLAILMQFAVLDINAIKQDARRLRRSPSDVLITRWSDFYGHNTTELFKLLSDMGNYQAMQVIKDLVHERYHIWFESSANQVDCSSKILKVEINSNMFSEFLQQETLPNNYLKQAVGSLLTIPEISVEELNTATNNWAIENVIGQGGYGVVYKGRWNDEVEVAIKKIEFEENRANIKDHWVQSLNELRYLNKYRHENILPIYGYKIEGNIFFLVFKLMSGGSLKDRLDRSKTKLLHWSSRFKISIGIAKGLVFLHSSNQRPLIHCDIKPDNILLDSNDNPMIADFAFSRRGLENDETLDVLKVFGTRNYTPKDCVQHKAISTKVDVFCFGIILFELATGKKHHEKDREPELLTNFMANYNEQRFEHLKLVIDRSVPNDPGCFILCSVMISLGKICTNENAENRPNMKQVWLELQRFVASIKTER